MNLKLAVQSFFRQRNSQSLGHSVLGKNRLSLLLAIFGITAMILETSCNQCKFKPQIDNGNAEPENLEITLEPCVFLNEPEPQCWDVARDNKIDAIVNIEVRTAMTNPNDPNSFILDPNLYDEMVDEMRDNMSWAQQRFVPQNG